MSRHLTLVGRLAVICGLVALGSGAVFADTVQMTNGDTLKGDVTKLDAKEVLVSSENFGELTIPRAKVSAIYLGDYQPPAVTATGANPAAGLSAEILMQNPLIQQQLGKLLGGGLGSSAELQNLPQNANKARDELQKLKDDLGPGPEADALDGYLRLFELFGGAAAESP